MARDSFTFGFGGDDDEPEVIIRVALKPGGHLINQLAIVKVAASELSDLVLHSFDSETLEEARTLLENNQENN